MLFCVCVATPGACICSCFVAVRSPGGNVSSRSLPTACVSSMLPGDPCRCHHPCAALCLSPEGRGARETHIKLPTELMGSFPPHSGDDARFLVEIAEPKALDRQ